MLTPAQQQTLKAHIAANTTTLDFGGGTDTMANVFGQPFLNSGDALLIADWYNLTASPDYHVWRDQVSQSEIMLNGFDWTRVDNLSVGKARIWEWMFDNPGKSIYPSKANIRAGIDAVWVGTQADLNVRAAVYVHCRRLCSNVEKVFVSATPSGTGTRGSTANPDMADVTVTLSGDDISSIHGLV